MSTLTMTVKDARDLSFTTRDAAIDVVIRLMKERDALLEALEALIDGAEAMGWDTTQARAAIKAVEEGE